MGGAIWVNGVATAHVSATDRGLALADGLFETMRARNGKIFKRDRHLARLTSGLAVLGITPPASLEAWIDVALASCPAGDVRVRLTVTRGDGPPGLIPPPDARPTVIVAVTPLSDLRDAGWPQPIALHVASGRRNERAMTAGLKTLSYTDGVMAMLEARRHGADDALLLDTRDHCSETTACNLFICTGGTIATPPTSCGALPGITRAVVMDLALEWKRPCEERAFDLATLLAADEVFVTNSTRGPVPVGRVGERVIGSGECGPHTRWMFDSWRTAVLMECP